MPTSVRSAVPKDVFIGHSKGDTTHADLADFVGMTLASLGRSLWEYDDWDWEETRKGGVYYRWSGRADQLDGIRYATGQAPFRHREVVSEIDRESLDELLQTSRVLVLLAPTSGQLSEGCRVELHRISILIGGRGSPESGPCRPVIIAAGWTGEPLPDFIGLSPAHYLTLSNDVPFDGARLVAASLSAWVVHTLQTTYGVPGQHLLTRAVSKEQILDTLVKRGPNHRTLDFAVLEERSKRREVELSQNPLPPEVRWRESGPGMPLSPQRDDIGKFLRHLDRISAPVFGSGRFAGWLQTEVEPIHDWLTAQGEGSKEIDAARSLLSCIRTNWQDSFKRLEWAETPLDRTNRD